MSATIEAANVLHLPAIYRPPVKKLEGKVGKAMTIVAGFRCDDGVVLAADTEITFDNGTGKTYESKIFKINELVKCNLAYTGITDFAKEFVDHLRENITRKTRDRKWWTTTTEVFPSPPIALSQEVLSLIKTAYHDFWVEHYTKVPKDEKTWAHILVTLQHGDRVNLYRGKGRHFIKIAGYAVLGIGQDQAEAAFKRLYDSEVKVNEARYIMLYTLREIKGFVQGCGGDSEIAEIEDAAIPDFHLGQEAQTTKEIERDFDFLDSQIRPLMIAFSDSRVGKQEFRGMLGGFNQAIIKRRSVHLREYKKRVKKLEALYALIVKENT